MAGAASKRHFLRDGLPGYHSSGAHVLWMDRCEGTGMGARPGDKIRGAQSPIRGKLQGVEARMLEGNFYLQG